MVMRCSFRAVVLGLSSTCRRFSYGSDGCFSDGLHDIREKILHPPEKHNIIPDDLRLTISRMAAQLVALDDHQEHQQQQQTQKGKGTDKDNDVDLDVSQTLDSGSTSTLLERSHDGAAFIDLLNQLKFHPKLALEVIDWRMKQGAPSASSAAASGSGTRAIHSVHPGEYAKAIAVAGRAKDIDLAAKLFSAATSDGDRTTPTYNALMAVYMYNGITNRSMSVFDELKRDKSCSPTIATYNILLSIFGHSVLVDHMETVLQVIKESKLVPNISTYNTLIAGYLTAWMWDKMETTFMELQKGPLEPDTGTHLLMLRGYAHSGNLEKMESTYELVKEQVNNSNATLLRAMICAYCKSSDTERVSKIEELVKHIPQEEYRPWLNVLLMKLYAQEGLVEKMDNSILEAFSRNTVVTTPSIMCSIITSYFRNDAVDVLSEFVKRAELAGWRLCRSLYHCRMVLYGRHQRFTEMQHVLGEMESFKIYPCRRTYIILYKVYTDNGKKSEADKICGLMWKHGFSFPMNSLNMVQRA